MSSPIVNLARKILEDAEVLDAYFRTNDLQQPSFDINGPGRIKIDDFGVSGAHQRLITSSRELHYLALGPAESLRTLANVRQVSVGDYCRYLHSLGHKAEDPLTLSVVHRFNIAKHIPLEGHASFEELSKATGLPLLQLGRIIRFATTSKVFREPTPGLVAHTAASRLLVEDRLIQGVMDLNLTEYFPGCAKFAEALETFPGSEEPTETNVRKGWGLANDAQLPLFLELEARHPDRAAKFAAAMEYMATVIPASTAVRDFDWSRIGKGKVVDIGGGQGSVSVALACAFPDLSFVVQDFDGTVAEGRRNLPGELMDRIEFMAHDFFEQQPVKDAQVYFFRGIFHNWPDRYCVRILQGLVPALRKGSTIVIQDAAAPDMTAMTPWKARSALTSDLGMMVFFNSHRRELKEWETLLARADARFRVISAKPPQSEQESLNMIEVVWDA